jgi:hypothetical protein
VEHRLKTLPPYWDAVASGDKTFEVRRDDRGFKKGDVVILQRLRSFLSFDASRSFDGQILRKRIRYVLTGGQFGIEAGYVVLGLEDEDA